ncbi:MAG: SIMPL domain-containing protein [Patescibacteria group bacterium]|nr:SIMPL domain-containing protein [Patescibacteria group bacterium]MDD5121468.1 SIMPL domain-containing protein [Patescibacteria group bacterium]MDD5222219.1 SIMPL domain-containing protein [Patescibacteria group bacterium]MDD5396370.1 SIMPL domain-containing protein [Patescibacteria group bacterium]
MDEQQMMHHPMCHGHKAIKIIIMILLAVLLLTLSVSQIGGWKAKFNPQQNISVSGEGKAIGIPDIGLVTLSVVTDKLTAKEVMQENSSKMNEIIKFVKDSGVDVKDIQTTGYYLSPRYDWRDGIRIDRGYELTSSISVKMRNLDKVSEIIDGAVSRGANQVGDIQFIIDDKEKLRNDAREKAIAQAKEKARDIAKSVGFSLGRVVSFSENDGTYTYSQPIYLDKAMSGIGGGGAPSIEQGSQEITVNVTLGFELR